MKLIDLIKSVSWEEVAEDYSRLYEYYAVDDLPHLQVVFNSLRTINPAAEYPLQLFIASGRGEAELAFTVCGIQVPTTIDPETNQPAVFALDELSQENWLAMEIFPDTLHNFSKVDIIAHCLYEMSWNGFNK